MEPAFLGLVLDSSILIDAERNSLSVESFLIALENRFGDVEVVMSAVTVAELVHGVERAVTPEIGATRRSFIDELKLHIPVHPEQRTQLNSPAR